VALNNFVEGGCRPITAAGDGQQTLEAAVRVVGSREIDCLLGDFFGRNFNCSCCRQARGLTCKLQGEEGAVKAAPGIRAFGDDVCSERLFAVCASKQFVHLVHVMLARLCSSDANKVYPCTHAFKSTNQVCGDR